MSDPIKKCNNCSKTILWEKQGDKYYRTEKLEGIIIKSYKEVCPTCWEAKKDDYKKQLKEEMWEGKAGVSEISKGLVYDDGSETSHQISFLICRNCDKWYKQGEENLHWDCKKDNPDNPQERERERERESILAYFKKHSIYSIKLKDNKLVIKYQGKAKEEEEAKTEELKKIQEYIQQNSSNNLLTLEELQKTNNEKPINYLPYILGGIGIVAVIVLGWLLLRKNKSKKY